jgi:glycerol-3-phosphate dehydrogenase
MRYVTVLGAGLLVGTALAVIVPEGVHALYMSEIETNQMQTQHEFHADHKIVPRHLNQIDHDIKEPIAQVKIDHDGKEEVLPPVHQHVADRPRQLGSELGHKHSDTTHSAIGRKGIIRNIQNYLIVFRDYTYSWFCIHVNY